ncbi:MAG TPA: amino acid oxidase [Erysipelotrichaceae bacterium]|nr:amino acid oxidase [Erysipelotrichaceae bacterium]
MFDKIIIGAGLYGLYSALYSGKKGEKILVLEKEKESFERATYVNQARVHNGYHYPRSYSTATKSMNYFNRFNQDYSFCINKNFDQVYATSSKFSWTNARQFKKFCEATNIKCNTLDSNEYFKSGMCDGTFLTQEYTYDAYQLKVHFHEEIAKYPNIEIKYNVDILTIINVEDTYKIQTSNDVFHTKFLLNATYASTNQIINLLGFEPLKIKYELCEIILCTVSENLKDKGITVMDGPFFSLMPFGNTGYHSLTSVTFTPHSTSYSSLPSFSCQKNSNGYCTEMKLGNCNECIAKPKSAWPYMSNLAKKYLKDEYEFKYVKSLYSMKPILKASEIDDSRPTVIKKFSTNPTFISVLSGKINTIYDLDEVLDGTY